MIATRDHSAEAAIASPPALAREAEPLLIVMARLLLLGVAGLVMLLGWLVVWVLSYRLTHGNDFTYTFLVTNENVWLRLYDLLLLGNQMTPGLEPNPTSLELLVNDMVAGFVLVGIGYLAAVVLIDKGISFTFGSRYLVLGIAFFAHVMLFVMPGLYTTDLFSYVMYGHISALYGFNPYIHPPSMFPADKMVEWIHPIWHNAPSVYGPLWTAIGWLVARGSVGLGLMEQVLVYKALMGVAHLANLALVWWLLGRFLGSRGPRARLSAFTVFAWNPIMLFEVAGNAHNDGLMVTLLLLSLVPLAIYQQHDHELPLKVFGRASWRWVGACVFVAMSALVKYTTVIVGLFYVVGWARLAPSWKARAGWFSLTGLIIVGITLALFAPWMDPRSFAPMLEAAGGRYYTNSLTDLLALTIADQVIDPRGLNRFVVQEDVRNWIKLITKIGFVLYVGWECWLVWRRSVTPAESVKAAIEASVRSFLVLLLVVLMWVLAWYYTWPLALATMLGWHRTLTKVVVAFTVTTLPVFYAHHYWNTAMPGWVLFLYAVPPLLVPIVEIAWRRWGRAEASLDEPSGGDGMVPQRSTLPLVH